MYWAFLLSSSGWAAGYWLFRLQQTLQRRAAKQGPSQAQEP
jgi:hypothetical protein